MRFDDRVTSNLTTYAKQARIIHFDIDISEIGKNVEVDLGVLGDAKESLSKLLPLIETKNNDKWNKEFDELNEIENQKVIDRKSVV